MPDTSAEAKAFGWIGIGNMGYGMAMNLASKMPSSATLVLNDINTAAMDRFVSEAKSKGIKGVSRSSSPKEIMAEADVIFTSLPAGSHVRTVFTDPNTGLLSAATTLQKLFIETSTIHVPVSSEVRSATEAAGHTFLDAPVSGGIPVAAAGTLTSMCGGSSSVFETSRPYINYYCNPDNVFLCGDAGAGLATKLVNNYINFCSYLALCEGMNTGLRYGLDPKKLGQIINVSSGMCWNSLHMNPVKDVVEGASSNRDFEGGFPTELGRGIMDMATGLMDRVGAKSVFGEKVVGVFDKAVEDDRCKGKEFRSVWRLFNEDDGKGLEGL